MRDLAGKEIFDGDLIYIFYASHSTVVMVLAIVVGRTNTSLKIYRERRFMLRGVEKPERKLSTHTLKISFDEAIAFSNNKFYDNEVMRNTILEMVELSKQITTKK